MVNSSTNLKGGEQMQEQKRLLKPMEVALLANTTVPTLNSWYKWKQLNPDHELAKLLPEYIRGGRNGNTRYWTESDVYKIIEFKTKLPQGRGGIMGEVTQKYVKKED